MSGIRWIRWWTPLSTAHKIEICALGVALFAAGMSALAVWMTRLTIKSQYEMTRPYFVMHLKGCDRSLPAEPYTCRVNAQNYGPVPGTLSSETPVVAIVDQARLDSGKNSTLKLDSKVPQHTILFLQEQEYDPDGDGVIVFKLPSEGINRLTQGSRLGICFVYKSVVKSDARKWVIHALLKLHDSMSHTGVLAFDHLGSADTDYEKQNQANESGSCDPSAIYDLWGGTPPD